MRSNSYAIFKAIDCFSSTSSSRSRILGLVILNTGHGSGRSSQLFRSLSRDDTMHGRTGIHRSLGGDSKIVGVRMTQPGMRINGEIRMTKKTNGPSRREVLGAASAAVAGIALAGTWHLGAASASGITSIAVGLDRLDVVLSGAGHHRLLAFPVHGDAAHPDAGRLSWEGEVADQTKVNIPRMDGVADRLFQKFQLVDGSGKAVGAERYADDLRQLNSSPTALAWPESIKGVSCPLDVKDLAELGVRHTHINVSAAALVLVAESERDEVFSRVVDGRRIWFNPHQVRALDRQIRELTEAKINAVGVVINPVHSPGVLTHPRTDLKNAPNKMGAFNLSNEEGLGHFRGMMEFLSDRYCRGDAAQGSVGGWIIGNEVQSTWEWHNMGAATTEQVARQYADELRIAWHSVRNAGAAVPVFASFDHFWAMALSKDSMRHRPGKVLLDALANLTDREGSFPWHVAQHPYPENLFQPRFWNDATATFTFDSPRVTFKNVEILAAYLRRPEILCDGKPRRLIFSEQGLHAGDTAESEQIQAAAYALAYRRLSQVPGVEAFILHRHVDAAQEGGLKLGIWPLTGTGPGKRKRPIWDVVKAADTEKWEAACRFALPIVGMADWSGAKPRCGPFGEKSM